MENIFIFFPILAKKIPIRKSVLIDIMHQSFVTPDPLPPTGMGGG